MLAKTNRLCFSRNVSIKWSIKNNIALGEEENIDNELIQNAIKKSELFDFVDELNEKADTKIGELAQNFKVRDNVLA